MLHRIASLSGAVLVCALSAPVAVAHIEQTDTIDLVSVNKERTEVNLSIVQQNPWNQRTLTLLERKLKTYEAFVQQGELQRSYPQTAGKAVAIEVAYFVEPDAEALVVLRRLESGLQPKSIKLRWFKLPSAK